MDSMDDWHALKSSILEQKKGKEAQVTQADSESLDSDFFFNKTDIAIVRSLVLKGKKSLKSIRAEAGRSRVSVYLSLKKLKKISLIVEKDGHISLVQGPITESLRHLIQEGFDLESLRGERLLLMQALLEWKSIEQLSVERGISVPSTYKYLKELKPLVEQDGRFYRMKEEGNWSLMGLLKLFKVHKETSEDMFQIWSSPSGKLFKTTNRSEGTLTAFSRFREFRVNYSPDCFYYFWPEKNLSLEEIFVHSLRCVECDDVFPWIYEFYLKNHPELDVFMIDELALHFDVGNAWLDLQAELLPEVKDRDEGKAPVTFLSPENTFFSNSISRGCGDILKCERILKEEKLSWDMLFPQYVILKNDPSFRWQALISRFKILESRTKVKIPFTKKIFRIYLELAILDFLSSPRTIGELNSELGVSEYMLRNNLKRLLGAGKVKKLGGRPIRFEAVK